jgi:hypothetical protein
MSIGVFHPIVQGLPTDAVDLGSDEVIAVVAGRVAALHTDRGLLKFIMPAVNAIVPQALIRHG